MTISANVPAGPAGRGRRFLGGPWMMTLLFCGHQRHVAGPVGRRRAVDRAPVVLRQRPPRSFSLNGGRRAAARTRAGGNPPRSRARRSIACASASTGLIDDRTKDARRDQPTICARRLQECVFAPNSSRTRPTAAACSTISTRCGAMLESVLSFLRNGRRVRGHDAGPTSPARCSSSPTSFADMGPQGRL